MHQNKRDDKFTLPRHEVTTSPVNTLASGAVATAATAALIYKLKVPNDRADAPKAEPIQPLDLTGLRTVSIEQGRGTDLDKSNPKMKPGALDLGIETVALAAALIGYRKVAEGLSRMFSPQKGTATANNASLLVEDLAIRNWERFRTNADAVRFAGKYIAAYGVGAPLLTSAIARIAPISAFPEAATTIGFGLATAVVATAVSHSLQKLVPLHSYRELKAKAEVGASNVQKALTFAGGVGLNLGLWAIHTAQGWAAATGVNVALGVAASVCVGASLAIGLRVRSKDIIENGLTPQQEARRQGVELKHGVVLSAADAVTIRQRFFSRELDFFGAKPERPYKFDVVDEYRLASEFFGKVIDRLSDPTPLTEIEHTLAVDVLEAARVLCSKRMESFAELSIEAKKQGLAMRIGASPLDDTVKNSIVDAQVLKEITERTRSLTPAGVT